MPCELSKATYAKDPSTGIPDTARSMWEVYQRKVDCARPGACKALVPAMVVVTCMPATSPSGIPTAPKYCRAVALCSSGLLVSGRGKANVTPAFKARANFDVRLSVLLSTASVAPVTLSMKNAPLLPTSRSKVPSPSTRGAAPTSNWDREGPCTNASPALGATSA